MAKSKKSQPRVPSVRVPGPRRQTGTDAPAAASDRTPDRTPDEVIAPTDSAAGPDRSAAGLTLPSIPEDWTYEDWAYQRWSDEDWSFIASKVAVPTAALSAAPPGEPTDAEREPGTPPPAGARPQPVPPPGLGAWTHHPAAPRRSAGLRGRRGAAVLAAGLAVAVVAAVLLWPSAGDEGASQGPGTAAGSASPGLRSFDPPVPVPADGEYVETTVLASGDLEVTHWLRSRRPLYDVALVLPAVPGPAVSAKDVVVYAEGERVPGADSVTGEPESYLFPAAHTMTVRYLLTGAVSRDGTTPGRALAELTSLDLQIPTQLGVSTRAVRGADVLSLGCAPVEAAPTGASGVVRACGKVAHAQWRAELSGHQRDDRVIAQLQLP